MNLKVSQMMVMVMFGELLLGSYVHERALSW